MRRMIAIAAEVVPEATELPTISETLQEVATNPGIIRTYFEI